MTSLMTSLILAAILTLMPAPSPAWNESQAEFRARMEVIARAISEAAQIARPGQRQQMAMAVVVTFWGESRFSPLIHAGTHRGDGGAAICLGQQHQLGRSTEDWEALAGTSPEATARCARATAEGLKRAWWYCHGIDPKFSWPAAFVLYGSGRTCRAEETPWKGIFVDRAEKWTALVAAK